jgi:hypothetical protein
MRPRFVPYKRCKRCELASKLPSKHCRHCHHLSEYEVQLLKEKHQRHQVGNRRLGYQMFWCAVVLAGLLLVALIG